MSEFQAFKPALIVQPEPDAPYTVVISSGVTSTGLSQTVNEYELVLSGGLAISNTVYDLGQVMVSAGGVTKSDTVIDGGAEIVSAGGAAEHITVSAGALVSGAGVLDDGVIYGLAAGLKVGPADDFVGSTVISSGGVASALSVQNFGELEVGSSGSASATHVNEGGILGVDYGGAAASSTVSSGGAIEVNGTANATRISSGGYGFVAEAGSSGTSLLSGAVVLGGGELVIGSGGVGSSIQASTGATIEVESGGSLVAAILNGGTLSAAMGLVVSGLTVNSGGTVMLSPGAGASEVNLVSGTMSMGAISVVDDLVMSAGGSVLLNGLVEDGVTKLTSGRTAVLAGQITGSGLLAEGTGGGTLDLTGDMSRFDGTVVMAGGKVEISTAGGIGHGSLDFDQNFPGQINTVQIDAANAPAAGTTYSATLIDFDTSNDRVDLKGVAFTTGALAKVVKNVLTVVDGSYSASFTLSTTRAAHFVVGSDGAGGTLIRGVAGTPVVPLVQAAAAFAPEATSIGSLLPAADAAPDLHAAHLAPGANAKYL